MASAVNPFGLYLEEEAREEQALGPPEDKPWGMYEFAINGPETSSGWPTRSAYGGPMTARRRGRRLYVPTETAVCSVDRSSLTPGPMVEDTAAVSR